MSPQEPVCRCSWHRERAVEWLCSVRLFLSMTSESSTPASQEELQAHKVPLGWRDQCSGYVEFITLLQYYTKDGYTMRSLLIPLNVCRVTEWYMPWKCQNERHAYEEYVLDRLFH